MSDLISRRVVIDALCDNCDHVEAACPHYPCKQYTAIKNLSSAQPEGIYYVKFSEEDYEKMAEQLRKIPIVLTLSEPEIIRCKDCKHYKFADNRAFGFPVKRCEWTGFEDVDDDDFCSRAERRKE